MIKLELTGDWEVLSQLADEWPKRYRWFLREFAKRFTQKTYRRLLSQVNKIKGPTDYRRKLVVAEYRRASGSWFALAVKARPMSRHEAQTSIISVSSIFGGANPISDILASYGPWTVDSMPFVPSSRQAVVIIKPASADAVRAVYHKNMGVMDSVKALMVKYNVGFEGRGQIMERLRINDSLEKIIQDMEFGILNKKHWVPAIRWARINVLKALAKDKSLIGALIDVNNRKWVNARTLREKIKVSEIREMERFQERVVKALPPT